MSALIPEGEQVTLEFIPGQPGENGSQSWMDAPGKLLVQA
jgi:hypothetical protein